MTDDSSQAIVSEGGVERRKRRRKRSIFKRIPDKLFSKKFNIYQAILVVGVAYVAFRVIMMVVDQSSTAPAESP